MNDFTISEIMFMRDIIKEDQVRWLKSGTDEDVTNEFVSILSKLDKRIEEYQGFNKAMRHLTATPYL